MLSKFLRLSCRLGTAKLLMLKGPQKVCSRKVFGLIPPSQYDIAIPKKLNIGFVMKEYWETIPLFFCTFVALGCLAFIILWSFMHKVDCTYHSYCRESISRTMDLRNPSVHKIIIINQRYEPWPEMADVLDKMKFAERRALARLANCPTG